MAVFYQKYRPQIFADVIGQDPIVRTLRNAASTGELAHAYLFTGSRGVGKTTIARLLAKAANCELGKNGEPCGTCNICSSIADGSSLDVIEIDAASHTGVDNVRELIEHAQFRPTIMKTKVFIIDEVHMLSKAAFNALLKTLEEPPEHVLFILATTDIEKVPETIISRTQRFDFKRIGTETMTVALEKIVADQKLKLPAGVVQAVSAQSDGSMRDALSRLNMIASMGDDITLESAERLMGVTSLTSVQELVSKIVSHDAASLPNFFDNTLSGGADPLVLNRSVLQYLRKVLNAKLIGDANTNDAGVDVFATHVASVTLSQLLFIIRLFLRSYKEISHAPSPDLPILLAAIEASLHGTAPQAQQLAAPAKAATAHSQQQRPQEPTPSNMQTTVSVVTEQSVDVLIIEEEQNIDTDSGPIDTTVTMDEITACWPEVIAKIRVENSPIATLLKNSPITDVNDGKITVGVKYLFHKEHLDNKKHNALITKTIAAVSGKHLALKSIIKKDVRESTIIHTVDSISDALKVFGGELVE